MVRTALIISGGKGERLRPFTNDRPKPMILVAGRPILEYQVRWLAREGIEEVIFLCGYQAHVIWEHFGDGSRFGLQVQYSLEDEPLGRGGALKQGFRLVSPDEEQVVALNGDLITTQPLAAMLSYHRRNQAAATAMLTQFVCPYGIAETSRGGQIRGFLEKPRLPYWMNAGVYVLSREFFSRLPDRGDHETTAFPELAVEGRLFGYRSRAYWRTIDTIKDMTDAERELGKPSPELAAQLPVSG